LVLGWKEFNGTTQFCFLPQGEIKEYPLTLTLSRKGRGEKEDEKILTMPLTLALSRKGRGEKEDEKNLTIPLTLTLSRGVERVKKKRI